MPIAATSSRSRRCAGARERYISEWQRVQARFVDDPDGAVREADVLIQPVMSDRGYPMDDFDQRAADISVDHPEVVENYREGNRLARASALGDGTTDDLRQAMQHYRALFDELVERSRMPRSAATTAAGGRRQAAPRAVGARRASAGAADALWDPRLTILRVARVRSSSFRIRNTCQRPRRSGMTPELGSRLRQTSSRPAGATTPAGAESSARTAAEEVVRLRGSVVPEQTLARLGAERLWELLRREEPVRALGAITGGQAVQMVQGRARGDLPLRLAGRRRREPRRQRRIPTRASIPANSVPALVRRLNNALLRADQIDWSEGRNGTHWLAPILADAEAGFGGPLNAFELMRSMIEAGAAGVHYEDQLASEKKCGHLGGKVLVPTQQFVRTLNAARLAADVLDVPTVLVARTDALSAALLTSDVDEYDRDFVTGERTAEGFFRVRDGIDAAISRGLAYAPYADLVWFETSTPDLGEAQEFARGDPREVPRQAARVQLLAVVQLAAAPRRRHDRAASRSSSATGATASSSSRSPASTRSTPAMFELARGYAEEQMPAYVRLQEHEFALEEFGYTATRHQREVGRRLLRPRHAGGLARLVDARAQGLDRGGAVHDRRELLSATRPADEILTTRGARVRRAPASRAESAAARAARAAARAAARPRRGRAPGLPARDAGLREAEWRVAPAPADLRDRRCEITGPVERKMMINALNSGARVFMADFEDANSPTWENVVEGQRERHATPCAARSRSRRAEKSYRLNDETATLMIRPRGWHLPERHLTIDGEPVSASLFDFGLAMFHNARELLERGSGPYFYLPKLESHLEARLWARRVRARRGASSTSRTARSAARC